MTREDRRRIVVVGASVAGCATALLFADRGFDVTVVDRKSDTDQYKTLCTHFVQPVALPVIRKLGFEGDLCGMGKPTKAAFWTTVGWTDPADDYAPDAATGGPPTYALNLERRVFDPYLLDKLQVHPRIELRLGSRLATLRNDPGEGWAVSLDEADGTRKIAASLLVAADGRNSSVAKLLDITPTFVEANERSCLFGYFDNCPTPDRGRSLFMLTDHGMIFYYPLLGGRALISAYVPKGTALMHVPHAQRGRALLEMMASVPHGLNLGLARSSGPTFGYLDYPNQGRAPAGDRLAFVGDAALSLDPMSGVGCAFALISADLLVDSLADAIADPLAETKGIANALETYAKRYAATLGPHIAGVCADSLDRKSPEAVAATYRRINEHESLQRLFIALTGRLIEPRAFQRSFLLHAASAASRATTQ